MGGGAAGVSVRAGAGGGGADAGGQTARGIRKAPAGPWGGMRAWVWGVRASVG